MRALALALLLALATATPARAAGGIYCASPDGTVDVAIGTGRLPILGVISARVRVDDARWATSASDGETPIAVGQASNLPDGFRIDFVDEDISEILLSLRAVSANEGDAAAVAGVLRLPGEDARAVVCEIE